VILRFAWTCDSFIIAAYLPGRCNSCIKSALGLIVPNRLFLVLGISSTDTKWTGLMGGQQTRCQNTSGCLNPRLTHPAHVSANRHLQSYFVKSLDFVCMGVIIQS
jgi:hypothetical protein